MEFKKFGSIYVVRIDRGEEIIESLKAFAAGSSVKLGSISGIGAVNKATMGLFDTSLMKYFSKDYSGDYEISSLTGNISTMNSEVYLHIHACLSDVDGTTYGGHLSSAVVSATCEIFINAVDGEIDREYSSSIGINLIKF
jgi:predicted DNA-binding protein with PD1-like motif